MYGSAGGVATANGFVSVFIAGRHQESQPAVPESGRVPDRTAFKENLHLLIVEDERIVAEDLRLLMEDRDFIVTGIAASGEEAVREVQMTHPDVVLMDIRIQGELDGIQTALLIQKSLPASQPRILFLSAHDRESFPQLNSLVPGSFDYLRKPYAVEDLLLAIEKLLND